MSTPDEIKAAVEAAVGEGLETFLADKPAIKEAFNRLPELREITVAKVREHPAFVAAMDLLDKAGEDLELAQAILALIRELTPLLIGAVGVL